MASNTVKFLTAFDPLDQKHVTWLQKMMDMAETMSDAKSHIKMIESINSNPLGVKLEQRDALDWPHIHFVICAQYAKAVLKDRAWIPARQASS
jgi:hypothetical protein